MDNGGSIRGRTELIGFIYILSDGCFRLKVGGTFQGSTGCRERCEGRFGATYFACQDGRSFKIPRLGHGTADIAKKRILVYEFSIRLLFLEQVINPSNEASTPPPPFHLTAYQTPLTSQQGLLCILQVSCPLDPNLIFLGIFGFRVTHLKSL
jgi:hypothetical protein